MVPPGIIHLELVSAPTMIHLSMAIKVHNADTLLDATVIEDLLDSRHSLISGMQAQLQRLAHILALLPQASIPSRDKCEHEGQAGERTVSSQAQVGQGHGERLRGDVHDKCGKRHWQGWKNGATAFISTLATSFAIVHINTPSIIRSTCYSAPPICPDACFDIPRVPRYSDQFVPQRRLGASPCRFATQCTSSSASAWPCTFPNPRLAHRQPNHCSIVRDVLRHRSPIQILIELIRELVVPTWRSQQLKERARSLHLHPRHLQLPVLGQHCQQILARKLSHSHHCSFSSSSTTSPKLSSSRPQGPVLTGICCAEVLRVSYPVAVPKTGHEQDQLRRLV